MDDYVSTINPPVISLHSYSHDPFLSHSYSLDIRYVLSLEGNCIMQLIQCLQLAYARDSSLLI